ncbi:MAG: SLBB domain-containing protein [Syntrophorhabdus sp.]|jgi:protein involved in polysaccharide export with SLBB domain|nr:MAG: Polysialic acid transport protein KpsD precursor [Deltaproteobacteria bacterium ADurb.Bin135]HNQ46947.1 SLBB domain-containing protein [Syntrophorhabdus sp.]HNY71363.1 SLBB domain-containing protein [Syntrophorhabdus sp.]HOH26817.1 SLBB domain-containing protein [Syntrophorhabdus sp.]HQG26741.1 SLBB domain-containing protein [Syntrophorhabdus sp.]
MNLKKTIIVFFLILSFEGSGFAQMAQMNPAKPNSEEITLEKPYNTKDGIKDPQRISPEQLKQLGIKDSALPPQAQSVPSQKPEPDKPDQPKKVPSGQSSSQIPAAESLSEFELFIARGTMGKISTNIRQFGYDLFRQPPSTFAPADRIPVGPDYVIGPGDELRITIWGNIEGQWSVVVDMDGKITLPKVGTIGVTGLTFGELKTTLNKELSRYYTNFQMNVSMGPLRSMRVYIVGNAAKPGAYTISSLSTLVNSLFEAGGPNKTGSMRDIQVKRNTHTVVRFDMYDFLLKGNKTKDVRLMPEDVIFIPPVGPLAGIAGNVKNPAIYELKGETRLLDLIEMAGGLSGMAFRGRVQVQRTQTNEFRTVFEGDLIDVEKNAEKNFLIKDGDLIKVFSVADLKNTVTITGAVQNAGEYGVESGVTRVRDIISMSGGLQYYASSQMEITRVKVTQSGPQTERFVIDAFKAMEGDPANNVLLEMNDYLFVRTVPEWQLYRTVIVGGEVKYPGMYTITRGERLSSVLERAGGYTNFSHLRGAVFTRERVRQLQQKSLEELAERLERELITESASRTGAAVSVEEVEAKKLEMEQRKQFIESLKKVKATGRMTIWLAHLRLLKGSEYDIELEEGDTLYIPAENKVINVVGAVMSNGSFIYNEKWGYEDYVQMAGGYSRHADEDNVFVMKVDGSARKLSRGFMNWSPLKKRWEIAGFNESRGVLEAGDSIVVPDRLERTAWLRNLKDITQILANAGVAAATIAVLYKTLD